MTYNLIDILKKYDLSIALCYKRIENELTNNEVKYLLRKEEGRIDDNSTFYYLIELIAEHKMNDDDYGVTVDIQVKEGKANLQCQVDILKSNGTIYFEKLFSIAKNDIVDWKSLEESIKLIVDLPKKVVGIFIEDYFPDFQRYPE